VRVLLDENLPRDLVRALPGHDVVTVHGLGWAGLRNGELLARAAGHVDAFITMDANIEFQQRLAGRPFGVVVIHARSNRVADLLPLADLVLAALADTPPGTVLHVGR
jgi:predicted nuclease of predicted toxin-antitoxin system